MHHLTVSFLRRSGYKVAVRHHRNLNDDGSIKPKGGMTEIIIDSPHGEHFEGKAKCCDQDNYNKKLEIKRPRGFPGAFLKKVDLVSNHLVSLWALWTLDDFK